MIQGRYLPTGQGYGVALVWNATLQVLSDGVVSSALIPGPFLVAAVNLASPSAAGDSFEVTVVGSSLNVASVADRRLVISGERFMSALPGAIEGDAPTLAWVEDGESVIRFWPWYVYTGEAGALALWCRNHDGIGALLQVGALVSVWLLRDARAKEEPAAALVARRRAYWRTRQRVAR